MVPINAILKGREVVPTDNFTEWAEWMAKADRHVKKDHVGTVLVSTIFLGMNHNFHPQNKNLWFETMVFGDEGADWDGYQDRYESWEEAEKGHAKILDQVIKDVGGVQ